MKKAILMAAVASFIAVPAMANDPAKMDKKIDEKFLKIDTDKNGMISESEHEAASATMFDDADTDNSSSISKEEMKAFKLKEKEEWKDKDKS